MNIVQVYKQFSTSDSCISQLEILRWNGTPICPYCKAKSSTPMKKERRHHCNCCNTTFSVTTGTVFHKTKIDLQKWFVAISLVLNDNKGMSARQLAREIEVNKDTAWSMRRRIRRAMQEYGSLLESIVKVDENHSSEIPHKLTTKVENVTPQIIAVEKRVKHRTKEPTITSMV